jgi:hypothetical protein
VAVIRLRNEPNACGVQNRVPSTRESSRQLRLQTSFARWRIIWTCISWCMIYSGRNIIESLPNWSFIACARYFGVLPDRLEAAALTRLLTILIIVVMTKPSRSWCGQRSGKPLGWHDASCAALRTRLPEEVSMRPAVLDSGLGFGGRGPQSVSAMVRRALRDSGLTKL